MAPTSSPAPMVRVWLPEGYVVEKWLRLRAEDNEHTWAVPPP